MDNETPPSVVSEIGLVLEGIIGKYEPIENAYLMSVDQAFVVANSDGTESVVVETISNLYTEYSFNWNWAASFITFILVLWCFFRCVGGLLKCKV